jgi:hypothetical protein
MTLPQTVRAVYLKARLIGSVALLALVVGCSQGLYEKRLIEPDASQGQSCRNRCELLKTQCRQRQETRERACQDWYNQAKEDYDLCRNGGAGKCRSPQTCLGADMSICDRQYENCFITCGGRIEKRIKLSPDTKSKTETAADSKAAATN